MNRTRNGVLTIVALMMVMASVVRAQVMQQIPPDALLFVKINNVKAFNDKVSRLAQDLGLAQLVPQLADPLSFLQVQSKLQQGINVNGELAFVMFDPATIPGARGPQDAIAFLVPVTDYKALAGSFVGAKTEGEVSEIMLGGNERTFVAQWGNYAAMGPSRAVVATKPKGVITPPAAALKQLASQDIVLYVNFVALNSKLMPQLQGSRAQIIGEMEAGLRNSPETAKMVPLVKAVLNQMLNGAETFLNEAKAATIGITLVPEGINTTVMAEFAPGSYIAQNVAAMKNTDAPLLAGLPQGTYLVYGGSAIDAQVASKVLSDIADPLIKELLAVGPEMAPARQYLDSMKAYVSASKSGAMGLLAPTGQLGTESLMQLVAVQSGDAKVMMDSYGKMVNSQLQLMSAMNIPGAAAMKPQLTEGGKTVNGVKFNTLKVGVDPNAKDPVAMQQQQVMKMVYGPEGQVVHYGQVGDKLLMVSGVSDATISAAIDAAKSNSLSLGTLEGNKAVDAQLPKQRVAVMYFAVGDMATAGLRYAKEAGLNMPVQLPPGLPPVGASVSTDGATAIRVDMHVPTTLVQSLIAGGMQAYMQLQAGQPGAGGL